MHTVLLPAHRVRVVPRTLLSNNGLHTRRKEDPGLRSSSAKAAIVALDYQPPH